MIYDILIVSQLINLTIDRMILIKIVDVNIRSTATSISKQPKLQQYSMLGLLIKTQLMKC